MKKTVIILLASALTAVVYFGYQLSFHLPGYAGESFFMLGMINGGVLCTFITASLFSWHLRKEKNKNAILTKDVTRLSDEKKQSNVKAATYLTQIFGLERQLKELKQFRTEVCSIVKNIALDMDKESKESSFTKGRYNARGIKEIYMEKLPNNYPVIAKVISESFMGETRQSA